MRPPMTRTLYLVGLAMIMFAAGVFVQVTADSLNERVLAGVAVLGSLAVVLANVTNGD